MSADQIHIILEILLAVIVLANNIVSRRNSDNLDSLHRRVAELEQLLLDCMKNKFPAGHD